MADRASSRGPSALGLSPRAAGLALLIAGACGQPQRPELGPEPSPEPAPPASQPCMLLPSPVQAPDTVVVGLLDGIDPAHAPHPTNADERLVFHHLYDTLIRVDCTGEVRPGLAEAWEVSEGGRRWQFRLRREARFWDSMPVSAAAVAAEWDEVLAREATQLAGIDSVQVDGDREIVVFLASGGREPPRILAAPIFAIARRSADSAWPVGTGRYRVETSSAGTVTAVPSDGGGTRATFASAGHRDARDLLDRGADLLVTWDPAVIEYAERLDYDRIELPWDRTYLLLSTTRVQALRLGGEVGRLPARLLDSMARDAVRGVARGHTRPLGARGDFWELADACGDVAGLLEGLPPVPRGAYAAPGARRIVYDVADPVARDLAERMAALAAGGPGAASEAAWLAAAIPGLGEPNERVAVEGLSRDDLVDSLREGDDFAYIAAVSLDPVDACYERRRLIRRAQWLGAEELDLASAVLPLVDTRRHAIARRGTVGLRLEWDGIVSIETVPEDEGERR